MTEFTDPEIEALRDILTDWALLTDARTRESCWVGTVLHQCLIEAHEFTQAEADALVAKLRVPA